MKPSIYHIKLIKKMIEQVLSNNWDKPIEKREHWNNTNKLMENSLESLLQIFFIHGSVLFCACIATWYNVNKFENKCMQWSLL